MQIQTLSQEILDKIPIPIADFQTIRENGQIYVDKTQYILDLAQQKKAFFFARPRRFGKSLLLSTFASLFSRGTKDFKGLALENAWDDQCYPVFYFNFAEYKRSSIQAFTEDFCFDLKNQFESLYPEIESTSAEQPNNILSYYLRKIQGRSIVILIDEYDRPLTHTMDNKEIQNKILDCISSFFNVLKRQFHKCRFLFITGITRIAHVNLFSDANFITDITYFDKYANLLGITQNELESYFTLYIQNAASILDITLENIYRRIKDYYNGYQFTLHAKETVYAPWSIFNFLLMPENGFINYWYESAGTPTILVNYLKEFDYEFSFLAKNTGSDTLGHKSIGTITIDELQSKTDIESIPFPVLLLQTGHYTLRYRNPKRADLYFPNEEVFHTFILLAMRFQNKELTLESEDLLNQIPQAIDTLSIDILVKIFNAILTECTSPKSNIFSNEYAIRDLIFTVIPDSLVFKTRESPNAFGYSDLELRTKQSCLCIEMKRAYPGKSVQKAFFEGYQQIEMRNYGLATRKYSRVVMVIESEKRMITKWALVPHSYENR